MIDGKKIITYILLIIAVATITIGYISTHLFSFYGNKIKTVVIGGNKFQAEVVSDPEKMQKGLSSRKELCQNCAMLFQFPNSGQHSFWMKNMRFPLDFLWILDGKIVHIEKNIPANFSESLLPKASAWQVLEINAGLVDKLNIKIGDQITFP